MLVEPRDKEALYYKRIGKNGHRKEISSGVLGVLERLELLEWFSRSLLR